MDTVASHSRGESSGEEKDEGHQNSSINPRFQEIPIFSGELVGNEASIRFLPDEDIVGIHLVQDSNLVKTLQKRLGLFNHMPKNLFPVNWAISLKRSHLKSLETEQFVVTPKPTGIRCLFFADSEGVQYMQNGTQNMFKLTQSNCFQLIPAGTVLDGIVVRKIVRGKTTQNRNKLGKPTFVIMDATRVNGKDVTRKSILDRISIVQAEIIQVRLASTKKKRISTQREIFELDIAHYKPTSSLEEYVTQGFKDNHPYPVRSFLFYHLDGNYACGNQSNRILQWDENNEQECSFRFKVSSNEGQSTGELYLIGTKEQIETKYTGTIKLTDELKTMNGSVIDCRYLGNRWHLVCVRKDRKLPNSLRTISDKLENLKNPVTREMLLASLKKGSQESANSIFLKSPNFVDFGFKKKAEIPGEFVGIDLKVTFLENGNVEGISLVQNFHFVRDLQTRLGGFNHGPSNRFPGNQPIFLNVTNLNKLKAAGPVVVAPKPLGIRYLLYVDPEGKIYMENETQHIFVVDQDFAPRLIPKDTVLDGIVVRKIVRDGAAQNNNQEANGKLTFVIMDATRVNGVDLTQKNIQHRISFVQTEVMQNRIAIVQADEELMESECPSRMKRRRTNSEVFDLDIAKYVEAESPGIKEYPNQAFKDNFEYPLSSFVFSPRVGSYSCGGNGKRIFQWNESTEVECAFFLKFNTEECPPKVELFTNGPYDEKVKFKSTIEWTEELKEMDRAIIDCRYLDGHWIFLRANTDRELPNCIHWISGRLEEVKRAVPLKVMIASLENVN